ncbi:MAG: single-stranded DNA-binding protein [Chitinophagaceae bacterium]|nr:single-stranded DNA-binding protein [Chitinophagaceae bacterium]
MVRLHVIGHLGKDGVVNNVNGKNVINFTVAHSEKFKDAQGVQKDKTLWVDCAYWTERTGIAPYLKKGTQVYAEGVPDIRTYTTADGRQGSTLSLRVSTVQLLGGRSGDGQGGEQNYQERPNTNNAASGNPDAGSPVQNQSAADITEPLDDLPF